MVVLSPVCQGNSDSVVLVLMQNKPAVAVTQDLEAKMSQMVCSLDNKDECLSCGSWGQPMFVLYLSSAWHCLQCSLHLPLISCPRHLLDTLNLGSVWRFVGEVLSVYHSPWPWATSSMSKVHWAECIVYFALWSCKSEAGVVPWLRVGISGLFKEEYCNLVGWCRLYITHN